MTSDNNLTLTPKQPSLVPVANSTPRLLGRKPRKASKLVRLFRKDHLNLHTYLNLMILLLFTITIMLGFVLINSKSETEHRITKLEHQMAQKADAIASEILTAMANKSIAFHKSLVDDREKRSVDVLTYAKNLGDFQLTLTKLHQVLSTAKVLMPACQNDPVF